MDPQEIEERTGKEYLGDHDQSPPRKGEREQGASYQPHLPRGTKRGSFPPWCPRQGAWSPGAEWLERPTEASGQQREPGRQPGTRPALGARGTRGGSAPPGPARGPRRRRPASQLRPWPQRCCDPWGAAAAARGTPDLLSPPPVLLPRLLRPSPAQPTERTARFTSHCSVLLFSRVFVVSSRSEAKSENLRWSPRAGRAKPGRRGRGAGRVVAPLGVGAFSRSQGRPRLPALYNIDAHVK
nr:uncharacterized protein LOC123276180 [Equus asinus]